MSSNSDEDNPDESTDEPPRSDKPGKTASGSDESTDPPPRSSHASNRLGPNGVVYEIRGPGEIRTYNAVARAEALKTPESDRSDEELAASLRAQTDTVSGVGDDIADRIERGETERGAITRDLLELSNLLVEIAHTVDRAQE